eukprot:m.204877 g.204877  ORF g.204877 m.204877 type:complete len:1582 (-) comp16888_c0_seq3:32-4777(-)
MAASRPHRSSPLWCLLPMIGLLCACGWTAECAVCEETYAGFPSTICNTQLTSCDVQCLGEMKPTLCADIPQLDCQAEICSLNTCVCEGDAISCGSGLTQWPSGLPISTATFHWLLERQYNIDLSPLLLRPNNNLAEIELTGVVISRIDDAFFGQLPAIKRLVLASANLPAFPWPVLQTMTLLTSLELNGNMLTTLDLNQVAQAPKLKLLSLTTNMIESVTSMRTQHPALERLYLLRNLISRPENITLGLTRLQRLVLGGNRLTYLTRSMFDPAIDSLSILEVSEQTIVYIPFALLTDVLAPVSPGATLGLSTRRNPSNCTAEEKIGRHNRPFLDWSCSCQLFYSDGIVEQTNGAYCPLPTRMSCPLSTEKLRLTQYCDGEPVCPFEVDEICTQARGLREQRPPACFQSLLHTASDVLSYNARMNKGIFSGTIDEDGIPIGDIRGNAHDFFEIEQSIAGLAAAGYLLDVPMTYMPIPFRVTILFRGATYMRVYPSGKTTGDFCDALFSDEDNQVLPESLDELMNFPLTLEDDPSLRDLLPTYDEVLRGVPPSLSSTSATGSAPTADSSTTTFSDLSSTSPNPSTTGLVISKKSNSPGGGVIGGVVGGVAGVALLIAGVLVVLRSRSSPTHNSIAQMQLASVLQQRSKRLFAVEYRKLIGDLDKFELSFQTKHVPHDNVSLGSVMVAQGKFGASYQAKISPTAIVTRDGSEQDDSKKAMRRPARDVVAIVLTSNDQDLRSEFLVQARVLLALSRHPSILSLYGVVLDKEPYMCLTEAMPNGTLQAFFNKKRATFANEYDVADLFQCLHKIAAGMTFIESKFIVHRNLSLENIHVGLTLGDVRISGFALAKNIYRSDVYLSQPKTQIGFQPTKHNHNVLNETNPLRYCAPEVLEDGEFTIKTDVFAFGVVMWEVLHLGVAFDLGVPVPQLAKQLRAGVTLTPSQYMANEPLAVVRLCLDGRPRYRPSFETLHTKLTYMLDGTKSLRVPGASEEALAHHDQLDIFQAIGPAKALDHQQGLEALTRVDPSQLVVQSCRRMGEGWIVQAHDATTKTPLCLLARLHTDNRLWRDLRLIAGVRSSRFLPVFGWVDRLSLDAATSQLQRDMTCPDIVHGLLFSFKDCVQVELFLRHLGSQGTETDVKQQVAQVMLDLASILEYLVLHKCDPSCVSLPLLYMSEKRLFTVLVPLPDRTTSPHLALHVLRKLVRDMQQLLPVSVQRGIHEDVLPLIAEHVGPSGGTNAPGSNIRTLSEAILHLQHMCNGSKELSWASLEFVKVLGSGQFGEVQLMTLKTSGKSGASGKWRKSKAATYQLVAVKTLLDNSCATEFLEEMRLMSSIHHPNLVSMLFSITKEEPAAIVLEYLPHGSLEDWLHRPTTRPTVEDVVVILYQVACGAAELARLGIVHRDIAARNVLLGQNLECKLSDYGLSRVMQVGTTEDANYYTLETNRSLPLRWIAPEMLLTRKFTTATDVYAFGMLLYEILSKGDLPFPDLDDQQLVAHLVDIAKQVQNQESGVGQVLAAPSTANPALVELFYLTTNAFPQKRIGFQDIITMLSLHNIDSLVQGILPRRISHQDEEEAEGESRL